MSANPKYSIFWDYSTAPLPNETSVLNLIREIEKKFYPKDKPEPNAFLFYMNVPYPNNVDIEFEKELKNASFQIIKSDLQKCDPEADKEISNIILRHLRQGGDNELVLICGERHFGKRDHLYFDQESSKFYLIHGNCTNLTDFQGYAAKCVTLCELMSYIDVPFVKERESSNPSPFTCDYTKKPSKSIGQLSESLNDAKIPRQKTMLESDQARDLHDTVENQSIQTSEDSSWPQCRLPSAKAKPTEASRISYFASSNEKFSEIQSKAVKKAPNASQSNENVQSDKTVGPEGGHYICRITYAPSNEGALYSILKASLREFGGKLISLSGGEGVLEFRSQEALTGTAPFLKQLDSLKIKSTSHESGVEVHQKQKAPKKSFGNNPRNTASTLDGSSVQTRAPHPSTSQHGDCGPNPPRRAPRSSDAEEKIPRSGYYIILRDLKKKADIKSYRLSVLELLGPIKNKAIYFDSKFDWGLIEFHSKSDQVQAQYRLAKEKIFDGQKLNPEPCEKLPDEFAMRMDEFLQRIGKKPQNSTNPVKAEPQVTTDVVMPSVLKSVNTSYVSREFRAQSRTVLNAKQELQVKNEDTKPPIPEGVNPSYASREVKAKSQSALNGTKNCLMM